MIILAIFNYINKRLFSFSFFGSSFFVSEIYLVQIFHLFVLALQVYYYRILYNLVNKKYRVGNLLNLKIKGRNKLFICLFITYEILFINIKQFFLVFMTLIEIFFSNNGKFFSIILNFHFLFANYFFDLLVFLL